jgi:hypothetical protein
VSARRPQSLPALLHRRRHGPSLGLERGHAPMRRRGGRPGQSPADSRPSTPMASMTRRPRRRLLSGHPLPEVTRRLRRRGPPPPPVPGRLEGPVASRAPEACVARIRGWAGTGRCPAPARLCEGLPRIADEGRAAVPREEAEGGRGSIRGPSMPSSPRAFANRASAAWRVGRRRRRWPSCRGRGRAGVGRRRRQRGGPRTCRPTGSARRWFGRGRQPPGRGHPGLGCRPHRRLKTVNDSGGPAGRGGVRPSCCSRTERAARPARGSPPGRGSTAARPGR